MTSAFLLLLLYQTFLTGSLAVLYGSLCKQDIESESLCIGIPGMLLYGAALGLSWGFTLRLLPASAVTGPVLALAMQILVLGGLRAFAGSMGGMSVSLLLWVLAGLSRRPDPWNIAAHILALAAAVLLFRTMPRLLKAIHIKTERFFSRPLAEWGLWGLVPLLTASLICLAADLAAGTGGSAAEILGYLLMQLVSYCLLFVWVSWAIRIPRAHHRVLRELERTEERYRYLLHYAPVPLWEEDFSPLVNYIRDNPREFENSNVASIVLNAWRYFSMIRILDVNQAAIRLAGAGSKEELIERIAETATPDFSYALAQEMIALRDGEKTFTVSTTLQDLAHRKQTVIAHWSVLPGHEEDYSRVLVSITDTTEVTRQARQLRHSLREKEELIKEVHHRVRNSLAIAYSIMGLEQEYSQDGVLKELLQDSMNRIYAIALIHTQLYQNPEILSMNIRNYLKDMQGLLGEQLESRRIRLELEVVDLEMHIDQVLPLGIILNELITNSWKHAFPSGFSGLKKVSVKLSAEADEVRLLYSDSGVGAPRESMLNPRGDGLGMSLVLNLGTQLNARVDYYQDENWNRFSMIFPLRSPGDGAAAPGEAIP